MSTAHGIGTVAFADVGIEVWSTERFVVQDPIGGVIVHVTEAPDPETGERIRSFECVDTSGGRVRWSLIRESELGPDSLRVPDMAELHKLIRRLAGEIAWHDGRHLRRGNPDAYEAKCSKAIAALLAVVGLDQQREGSQRMLDPAAVAAMWRRLAEAVAMSSGPLSTDMAQRAFAIDELQFLVFGPDGLYHATLERPAPGKAAAPRPTAPPAPAAWFVD